MSDVVTSFVDAEEAISIRVGRWFLSKGFNLAGVDGCALDALNESRGLSILGSDSNAKPQRYLFGLIAGRPRREFLGTVWFNNEARGASEKDWIFEVHGRNHLSTLQGLANEMAVFFGVNIFLRLVCECAQVERFPSDYDA